MKTYAYRLVLVVLAALFINCGNNDDTPPPFYADADALATTYDPDGTVNSTLRNEIYALYTLEQWSALERLFEENNLNGGWPPANGGFNTIDNVPITTGKRYDRYSGSFGMDSIGNPILGGTFTSPIVNNTPYSFEQRALNRPENTYDFYYEIEVIQDLPFFSQDATVIPWFGQIGLGKQAMWKIPIDETTGFPKTWNKLAEEGFIKITIISSPSGNFSNLVGTTIPNP